MARLKYRIIVLSNGETTVFYTEGGNLYHQLAEHSLIHSPCGGNNRCGQCKIKAELPAGEIERKLLSESELNENIRLACCHKIDRNLSITIQNPPKKIKSIAGSALLITDIDPIVRKKSILIDKNHGFPSDKTYLEHCLGAKIGNMLTRHIPSAIQAENIDAVITYDGTVASLCCENPLLMAVDIGTTTIAGELRDLRGNMIARYSMANSQRKYGYDIISRMQYAVDGLENLKKALTEDLNFLVLKLSQKSKSAGKIVYVCITANSAMTHIAYGIPTDRLAAFPYKNSINVLETNAAEMNINSLDKATPVHFVPLVDAYIGGDILADLTALSNEENFLLCDIGTNCEVVLKKNENIWATSAPSGPAFEGGNIECGMTAADGAIKKVLLSESDDLKIETIGNKPAAGIAGSGVISAVAQLVKWKMVGSHGKLLGPGEINSEVSPPILKRIRRNKKGERVLFLDYSRSIYISQSDIEQFIFAKAAITSAIKILLDRSSTNWSSLSVMIAGGFGYFVSRDDLITTGIISKTAKKINLVGNTALTGAMKMLLSQKAFRQSFKLSKSIKTITLSNYKDYQNIFLNENRL
ncbi:MAG: DUF4445 domain-containing protein [Epsilonproteobacteria bacterium]|nr:DUF4445 domain-containing protein [Campylobacterota bacterium]